MDEKEAMAFEKLMERNPKEALKYVNEFTKTVFWQYFKELLGSHIQYSYKRLYECEMDQVQRIRGCLDAYAVVIAKVESIKSNLEDQIDLDKESAKVEEARKSE